MLAVNGLSKMYGARTLFDGISFTLRPRERLGLVGRNGSGKSTIFRIILGEESADAGSITMPKGYRVGHLAQHLEFHEESVLKEACLGLPEDERDQEYRAEIILAGLGFNEEDIHKSPASFSGGFQIRINLAKLLLSEPNLLLLDEPTNYLDIVSVRWLQEFLREWQNEVIIISHDRLFMDSVTTDTMVIHRSKVRKVQGGTEKLYSQIVQDEEVYEKTRVNEDKKRKELEAFIVRFRAQASKASLVQSKVKALERMGEKEALAEIDSLEFQFNQAPFEGKQMAEIEGLSFNYPNGPTLIENLGFTLRRGDRIGIIGKNGKGKSTLLRLLAGELTPTSGHVEPHALARVGYFGQTNIGRLNPKLTVESEISAANPQLHRTAVRSICGTMMFEGDDALKKISVLSGGEKSRVLLGKILATPTNLLLLDEPTNHLDMESIEALIETLKTYEGAVVVVTHSELILRELATRLIVFQGSVPHLFEHDYEYFLQKEGWDEEREGGAPSQHATVTAPAPSNDAPKGPPSLKLQKQMKKVEDQICEIEAEQKKVEVRLAAASEARDVTQIRELSKELERMKRQVEERFSELERLSTSQE